MTRDEWLSARRMGLGSSDAAAILGVSPWRTPLEVYLDKIGVLPDRPPTKEMKLGTLLEPVIATLYADEQGEPVEKPPAILQDRERPFMLASLDYRRVRDGRIVECKSVNGFAAHEWGEPGTDAIPTAYLVQVSHQMIVAGTAEADVAALIDRDLRVYTVRRVEKLVIAIIQAEAVFWERVVNRNPPEPDFGHPSTLDMIRNLYGVAEGVTVDLGPDAAELAKEYTALADSLKAMDARRDELRARLLYLMQAASEARLPDGTRLTRRQVNVKEHVVRESTHTRFTVKAPKGAA